MAGPARVLLATLPLNEVAAVTRRLIEGLMDTGTIVPVSVLKAFESKSAIEKARTKLRGENCGA